MLITILVLGLAAVLFWDRSPARRARLGILFWTLAGSLLALVILALAPANSLRLGTPPPGLVELVCRTSKFPLEFIIDIFRSMPLSTLINFLLPAVIFYVYYSQQEEVIPAIPFQMDPACHRRCIAPVLSFDRRQLCPKCLRTVLPCAAGPFFRPGCPHLCFNGEWCFNWHAGRADPDEAHAGGCSLLAGNRWA